MKYGFYFKEQWIALIWTARLSALLSFLGSFSIIYMILRRRKVRLAQLHNRLLFVMSFIDTINSISTGIGPLAAPKDSADVVYSASGTKTTCNIQGFVFNLGLAVPAYNAMLCVSYLMVIRFNSNEEKMQSYERFMHAFALLPALVSAIIGASSGSFDNEGGIVCWMTDDSERVAYAMTLFFAAIIFLIIFGTMVIILFTVHKQSAAMGQYQSFSQSRRRSIENRRHSTPTSLAIQQRDNNDCDDTEKEAVIQAFSFVGGYIFTYTCSCMAMILDNQSFGLTLLVSILLPLQGVWNFIAFIRPKYVALRRKFLRKSFRWVFRKAIFSSLEEEEEKKRIRRRRSSLLEIRQKRLHEESRGRLSSSEYVVTTTISKDDDDVTTHRSSKTFSPHTCANSSLAACAFLYPSSSNGIVTLPSSPDNNNNIATIGNGFGGIVEEVNEGGMENVNSDGDDDNNDKDNDHHDSNRPSSPQNACNDDGDDIVASSSLSTTSNPTDNHSSHAYLLNISEIENGFGGTVKEIFDDGMEGNNDDAQKIDKDNEQKA